MARNYHWKPLSGVAISPADTITISVWYSMQAPWLDRIRVYPQFLLPQHLISRFTRYLTRCRWRPLKNFLIRVFIRAYSVDMSEALQEDYRNYLNFNDFFTRALKPTARKFDPDRQTIIAPIDGYISQIGEIENDRMIQAKNHDYSMDTLLAGDNSMVETFADGSFATLYLSPADYHRIHMPADGRLLRMIHVPGKLFAVNTHTTRVVRNLFTRNERIICLFDTTAGPMALIMVGAINVGSMETLWAGEVAPSGAGKIRTWHYENELPLRYSRGDEIGRFNMGSTVILLFANKRVRWDNSLQSLDKIRMGETLADTLAPDQE